MGWVKRHRVATVVACLFLVFAGAASAYYLFYENGKGTTTPVTVGTVQNDGKELALTGTIAAISGPGHGGEVTIKVTNSSASAQQIDKITGTPVIGEPYLKNGCQTAWFSFQQNGNEIYSGEGLTTPLSIPIGETTLKEKALLQFVEKPESQNACSGASVSVQLQSTP